MKSKHIFTFLKLQGWLVLGAFFVPTLPIFGQLTSGNIQGTVYDPSGAPAPGAAVIARNIATGVENPAVSTSTGE